MAPPSKFEPTSIRTRLVIPLFALAALISATAAAYHYGFAFESDVHQRLLRGPDSSISLIDRICQLQAENRTHVILGVGHDPANPVPDGNDHAVSFHTDRIRSNVEQVTGLVAVIEERSSPEHRRALQQFKAAREAFVRDGLMPAVNALTAGDYKAANQILSKKVIPLYMATQKVVRQLDASAYRL